MNSGVKSAVRVLSCTLAYRAVLEEVERRGIKVEYLPDIQTSSKGELCFSRDGSLTIKLRESLAEYENIVEHTIVMAHELGHAISYQEDFASRFIDYCIFARCETVLCEKEAWRYAIHTLKRFGFKEWRELIDVMFYALRNYYSRYAPDRIDELKVLIREYNNELVGTVAIV